MQEFLWEKERERERERSEIQKSWRITRASKSLEFHPGKKEIGEWVGRGDIPRASGFVWTPITPVSRNGRRRREPIRPDTPGISGEDPYADSSRVALESNVGELARDVARDRRTFVRDFATKEEGRKKSYASEFVARARPSSHTRPPNVERNDRFEFPCSKEHGKVERWLSCRNFMFFVR